MSLRIESRWKFYFKMKIMKFIFQEILIVFIAAVMFLSSCSDNSTTVTQPKNYFSDSAAKALVAVVENRDIAGFSDENLYNMFKYSITPVLSAIFSVPVTELNSLSLQQMIQKYGEPWEIQQILAAATGFYDKIIILNNETATFRSLIDTLKSLKTKYTIDMIFNIHGTQNSILLTDGEIMIGNLTDAVKSGNIKIRTLYQTCCYGKFMAEYWNSIGVVAVNGAVGNNVLTTYSPIYFINEWVSGRKTFENAVFSASNREIEKLRSYDTLLPVDTYILTPSNLQSSVQIITGADKNLLWKKNS